MLAPNKTSIALADKNTELAVRLKLAEEQNRLLRDENQRLKQTEQALEQMKQTLHEVKGELAKTVERKVLLEEEVRWLKAQYYGRSTQATDAAEQNTDQQIVARQSG